MIVRVFVLWLLMMLCLPIGVYARSLSWINPVSAYTYIIIEYSTTPTGPWTKVGQVVYAGGNTFSHAGSAGVDCYRVYAIYVDPTNRSGHSNVACTDGTKKNMTPGVKNKKIEYNVERSE